MSGKNQQRNLSSSTSVAAAAVAAAAAAKENSLNNNKKGEKDKDIVVLPSKKRTRTEEEEKENEDDKGKELMTKTFNGTEKDSLSAAASSSKDMPQSKKVKNDIKSNDAKHAEEKNGTHVEKPKFTFGQTSAFSKGFGIMPKSDTTIVNGNAISSSTDGSPNTERKEDKKVATDGIIKPFASSTSFGSGFGALKPVSSIDFKDSNSVSSLKSDNKFTFGSGSQFSSGFALFNNTSTVATDNSSTTTANNNDNNKNDKTKFTAVPAKPFTDITMSKSDTGKECNGKSTCECSTSATAVKEGDKESGNFVAQNIKSGEESEECILQSNAKLYELIDVKTGWKERGVGVIHVNKDRITGKFRIIMRSRGLLKVILNLPLVPGFKVNKGFPGSIQGEKFIRIIAVNENKIPVQFAIKSGKKEISDELFVCIETAIKTEEDRHEKNTKKLEEEGEGERKQEEEEEEKEEKEKEKESQERK
ncbi:uncharacterized protein SCODWIG_01572 [Saccharomycodes ludwigii]|uniref:RanBD1 domain-containing protein n=1 Tax=Saccharomycodes ludwigii TaxID=36035 RepID=A0A376B590_9ASCO|nr:hypothetical protein SCDLUD_000335 [Saccharomycodes ludwigii]KAH3902747.1 hypothetical protein SCDLUD_000335 [Saccharomycodes ludwigii]SSD59811.1 uncharacterized protein SCODWIG_01572 [Saccharomycodes ludwigii]